MTILFFALCLFATTGVRAELPAAFTGPSTIHEWRKPLERVRWRDSLVARGSDALWILEPGESIRLLSLEGDPPRGQWRLPDEIRLQSADGLLLTAASDRCAWVVDKSTHRVFRLESGHWSKAVTSGDSIESAVALTDAKLLLNTPAHSANSFAILDADGVVERRFGGHLPGAAAALIEPANQWIAAVLKNGDIVCAHQHRALLRRYRPDGTLVWERDVRIPATVRLDEYRKSVEKQIESDPVTCCVQNRIVYLATAILADGSNFALRYGLDPRLELFDGSGLWQRTVPVDIKQDWVTAGLAWVSGRLVAAEISSVVWYGASVRVIRGAIVDEQGVPIGDADVVVTATNGAPTKIHGDTSGRFTIAGIGPEDTGAIVASSPGYLESERRGRFREILETAVVLKKQPKQCVRVTATDTNQPMKSYRLQAGRFTADQQTISRSDGVSVEVNDASGTGCVSLPFQPPLFVRISSKGYATKEVKVASAEMQEIQLDPETPLTVRVVAADLQPIELARVSTVPATGDSKELNAISSDAVTTTDAEGAAVVGGLGSGEYWLVVEHPTYVRWQKQLELPVPGDELTVESDRGNQIEVHVVDAGSAQPIADSVVLVEGRGVSIDGPATCRTSVSGVCTVVGLPDGRFIVKVEHPGYARAHQSASAGAPDHAAVVNIRVDRAVAVVGRVLGVQEYGATALNVLISKPGIVAASAPVDPTGRFSFSEAPSGLVDVWVVERDIDSTLLYRRETVPEVPSFELTLEPPSAAGPARPDRGQRRSRLRRMRDDAEAHRRRVWPADAERGGEARRFVRGKGPRPRFLPGGDRRSKQRRIVAGNGFHDGRRSADVQAGRRLDAGLRHEGNVPAPGALVTVEALGQIVAETMSDSSGRAIFEHLAAGDARVSAVLNGSSAHRDVTIRAALQSEVALSLSEGHELRLHARDAVSGLPIRRLSVRVTGLDGRSIILRGLVAADDGVFDLPGFESGLAGLVIDAPGFAIWTGNHVSDRPELTVLLSPGRRSFTVQVDTTTIRPCALGVRGTAGDPVALSLGSAPYPWRSSQAAESSPDSTAAPISSIFTSVTGASGPRHC